MSGFKIKIKKKGLKSKIQKVLFKNVTNTKTE